MPEEISRFRRVAVLVLDYDPWREGKPSRAVVEAYDRLRDQLQDADYPIPTGRETGQDVIVLANEELVARHQADFERRGLTFFPDWKNSQAYRDLLKEGLEQKILYLMRDVGRKGGYGSWFSPEYMLQHVPAARVEDWLEINDPNGRIDIKPKHPAYA